MPPWPEWQFEYVGVAFPGQTVGSVVQFLCVCDQRTVSTDTRDG